MNQIYDVEFSLAIGPRIADADPDSAVNLRTETFDSVTVGFNEAIDFDPGGGGTFTVDDVSITGPEGVVCIRTINSSELAR